MTSFSVGEHVIIRYGIHQGKKATILTSQAADAYKVKAEDGFVLFFSGKGLQRDEGQQASGISGTLTKPLKCRNA